MTNTTDILCVCERALDWAREQNYTGWEKHDALNSPMLRVLSLGRKWPRIFLTQGIMRAPVNIRPLLGVRKHRNPKGAALFARAYLNLYRLTGNERYRDEAKLILQWLLDNPAKGFTGLSWGYPYPWQDLGFYAPPGFPNRIVTYFVGRALIHAWEVLDDRKYLDAAQRAVEFVLKEPKILYEDDSMKCLSYVPSPDISMAVMDVPALCGALCAMVGKHTGRQDLGDEAFRLINWVADKQSDYGAWFYTDPPDDSHITHDNYHTGEIVDSILEYEQYSGDTGFQDTYQTGLGYYRENLFTSEARPKWMNDREYPHDIHGYSQGIITFTMAGDLVFAGRVANAAIEDMWNERDGRFYYQKRRNQTLNYTPMRWAQGWMSYALSSLALAQTERRAAP
ncbi:MAG: hypothetical protein GXP52_01895 [Deltaproteobacteria bacterium]|nr:hypothetical protein [Deltaproteobacteria bacterium]